MPATSINRPAGKENMKAREEVNINVHLDFEEGAGGGEEEEAGAGGGWGKGQQPQAPATAEGAEPCVGILFLAHDGVANPALWEKWRASDPAYSERIKFFVFRNKGSTYGKSFTDRYDLKLRLRTKWCSASIIKATVQCYRDILAKEPSVAMIYLVSGFDIPIQPPKAFFVRREVVTEGVPKTILPFHTVLAYTPGEVEWLRAAKGWGKRNEDIRSRLSCHVQWCGLMREHVERIVSYPDLGRLLKLGNKLSGTCCPDEWILGTILALQDVDKTSPSVIDWPVTDQYRKGRGEQSPILWTDLEETKTKVFWAPPQTYRTFTLAAVLCQVSHLEGNLFFRKIGPLSAEEIERIYHLLFSPSLPSPCGPSRTASSSSSSSASEKPKEEEEEENKKKPSTGGSETVPSTPQQPPNKQPARGGARHPPRELRFVGIRRRCLEGGGDCVDCC